MSGLYLPDIVHHAVDAVAHQQAVALRLQMHVGRAQVERFAQQEVGLRDGLGQFAAHFPRHTVLPHDQFKLLWPATRYAHAADISHLCHGKCSLRTEKNGKLERERGPQKGTVAPIITHRPAGVNVEYSPGR